MEYLTGTKKTIDGIVFACWHVGINKFEHRSPVGTVRRTHNFKGYYAFDLTGQFLISSGNQRKPKQFREFANAARALIALAK